MNQSDIHKRLTELKRITKYGIIIFSLGLTAHCGLLFFGYDLFIVHVAACFFALWLGLSLSRVYGLCITHRLCVIYVCAVLLCIVLRRHDMFEKLGMDISLYRGVMFGLGITLQIAVLWKAMKKH